MQDLTATFVLALKLVLAADSDLVEIIALSLRVSLSAVVIACAVGLPLGALIAVGRFWGRNGAIVVVNALMGLPPVVVGLVVYLALSNAGPFGVMQLLYTPTAMIIAQTILVAPIVTALARQIIHDLDSEYAEQFRSLCVPMHHRVMALLWDGRHALLTVALAGIGRAIAEVGAVMIVGGNIDHLTRVMTTAIALETSKGDLALALALGMVLIGIAVGLNAAVMAVDRLSNRVSHG